MENKFICQYCGKDTSNVEYDYLNGYDHLSCALKAGSKLSVDEFDHCVLCGVETPYKRSTHVDMRIGYIEGAGQLCSNCYDKTYEDDPYIPLHVKSRRTLYTVSEDTILSTPNDQELGAKVRKLYWENKK